MNIVFMMLTAFFLSQPLEQAKKNTTFTEHAHVTVMPQRITGSDSVQPIHFINATSLSRIPSVVQDLSVAFKESSFLKELLPDNKGVALYLYAITCKSFETAAAVENVVGDSMYYVKLNRLNKDATDKALAATLIHETMHCVLLNIYMRAKEQEPEARSIVLGFGLRNDTSNFFMNDFFTIMEKEEGQHELMYRLFYPEMVRLLGRFAEIHKQPFVHDEDAESLMWSGLQNTGAFEKLSEQAKRDIVTTILTAKGIHDDGE